MSLSDTRTHGCTLPVILGCREVTELVIAYTQKHTHTHLTWTDSGM